MTTIAGPRPSRPRTPSTPSNPSTPAAPEYQLTPSGIKPWYGVDPILKTFPLQQLADEEIINGPPVYKDYGSKSGRVLTTPAESFRRAAGEGSGLIHPIFRRNNFLCKSYDYDILLPSLRLASLLLEDPSILPFFNGLIDKPLQRLGDDRAERLYRQQLLVFDWKTGNDDPRADQLRAWKALADLGRKIRFEFHDIAGTAYMQTRPIPGPDPRHANVTIAIQKPFVRVLRHRWTIPHYHPRATPFNHLDALTRTQFFLAICLVHETSHALAMSADSSNLFHPDVGTFLANWKLSHPGTGLPKEPFFRDFRISELGATVETVLFSGHIRPLGAGHGVEAMSAMRQLLAPYGLSIKEFPGAWSGGIYAGKERGSPAKWGNGSTWYAAIKMEYVRKLFSDRFWDEHVTRSNSVEVFHPQKVHLTRLRVKKTAPSPSESPGLHQNAFATSTPAAILRPTWTRALLRIFKIPINFLQNLGSFPWGRVFHATALILAFLVLLFATGMLDPRPKLLSWQRQKENAAFESLKREIERREARTDLLGGKSGLEVAFGRVKEFRTTDEVRGTGTGVPGLGGWEEAEGDDDWGREWEVEGEGVEDVW